MAQVQENTEETENQRAARILSDFKKKMDYLNFISNEIENVTEFDEA